MKIDAKDPDLYTVFRRVMEGNIDLQPDFQRDLVWNKAKKQGLIDTILRNWKFPPIFLVLTSHEDRLEVLDGQQRLNSIKDFFNDKFTIDGTIEPIDDFISTLHGLRFSQLPPAVQGRLGRYSVRTYELYEYNEGEPYELFFRLNQGAILTPAEKRNTLFGPVREEVKILVRYMVDLGLDGSRIGFNNNRLSYDDVLARLVYALETKSLAKKITDASLVELYRSGLPIEDYTQERARDALAALSEATKQKVKLSKPTLFTWLLYLANDSSSENIEFIAEFERLREENKRSDDLNPLLKTILTIYQERSASSVNDAIPVQLRLLSIYIAGWLCGQHYDSPVGRKALEVLHCFEARDAHSEEALIDCMHEASWGFE